MICNFILGVRHQNWWPLFTMEKTGLVCIQNRIFPYFFQTVRLIKVYFFPQFIIVMCFVQTTLRLKLTAMAHCWNCFWNCTLGRSTTPSLVFFSYMTPFSYFKQVIRIVLLNFSWFCKWYLLGIVRTRTFFPKNRFGHCWTAFDKRAQEWFGSKPKCPSIKKNLI